MEENKKEGIEIREWVQSIIIAILLAFFIKFFIFDFVRVDGTSMYPTLEHNDRVIISKVDYYFSDPEYGDIVILEYNRSTEYVKRIIGKPGDVIEIKDSTVYRNGEKLDEPYVSPEAYFDYGPITVPEGEYFVMGDNRAHSKDSRFPDVGTIPKGRIDGKLVLRLFPLSNFGSVYE